MRTFLQATSSQMGGRSKSPSTPHSKQRWIIKSAATLPEVALGEGEGRAAPTPAAITPCKADVKAWTVSSKSPRTVNPGAEGADVG